MHHLAKESSLAYKEALSDEKKNDTFSCNSILLTPSCRKNRVFPKRSTFDEKKNDLFVCIKILLKEEILHCTAIEKDINRGGLSPIKQHAFRGKE